MESSEGTKRLDKNISNDNSTTAGKRGRSYCGQESIVELAKHIIQGKKVVMLSGAGLSSPSGVRPLLETKPTTNTSQHVAGVIAVAPPTNTPQPEASVGAGPHVAGSCWATRKSFRTDPVAWYNKFWIPYYAGSAMKTPNLGQLAIRTLQEKYLNVLHITQNIDGLQNLSEQQQEEEPDVLNSRVIEAHGRVGLFKCIPDEDDGGQEESENSSESEDRLVKLGSRRKSNEQLIRLRSPDTCPYQYLQSLHVSQLEPDSAKDAMVEAHSCVQDHAIAAAAESHNPLSSRKNVKIAEAPRCPACNNHVMPLVLFSDETYHSHSFYQFENMEESLGSCDVIVFVGVDFELRLTDAALTHARGNNIPIYNFSVQHNQVESTLEGGRETSTVANIIGSLTETLPTSVEECERVERGRLLKAQNE